MFIGLFRTSRLTDFGVTFHFLNYHELFSWKMFRNLRHDSVTFQVSESDDKFEITRLKSVPTSNQTKLYEMEYKECNDLSRGQDSQTWTFFMMPGSNVRLKYALGFSEFEADLRLAVVAGEKAYDSWLDEDNPQKQKQYTQMDIPLLNGEQVNLYFNVYNRKHAPANISLTSQKAGNDDHWNLYAAEHGTFFNFIIYFNLEEHNNLAFCSLQYRFNLSTFNDPTPSETLSTCTVSLNNPCTVCCGIQPLFITAINGNGSEQTSPEGKQIAYSYSVNGLHLTMISLIPIFILCLLNLIMCSGAFVYWFKRYKESPSNAIITEDTQIESTSLLQS